MHLSDGTLRRSIDEPFAVDAVRRRHLEACPRCRQRAEVIRTDSERVTALLATETIPATDAGAALGRLHARLGEAERRRPQRAGWAHDPRRRARLTRWSAAVVCSVTVGAVLVGAGAAQGFITIFQPRQLAPVMVDGADVSSLQELASYGDVSGVPGLTVTAVTRGQAESLAGIALPNPSALPSGIPATPTYEVISGGTVTFTFDLTKAQAAARRLGATLPPMPADIAGSTLQLILPSAVVESYGIDIGQILGNPQPSGDTKQGGPAAVVPGGAPTAAPGGPTAAPARAAPELLPRGLVIVAAGLPRVTSTGATAAQVEDYLLAQPGVPSDLAAELRAIGDPSSTLPVPIPVSLAAAQPVSVDGASGLLIGDQTGVGSLVIWERGGAVYAVLGSLTSSQVLAVADSIG